MFSFVTKSPGEFACISSSMLIGAVYARNSNFLTAVGLCTWLLRPRTLSVSVHCMQFLWPLCTCATDNSMTVVFVMYFQ